MNFFRRPAPPKIKEPASDPPPASARQEKERNWLSTVSRRREASNSDRDTSRRREISEKSSEGGDRGGKSKGVGNGWLGTQSSEGEPQSSQASVRSKKSFFRTKATPRSETIRSNPSTSSSPASTTTPVFSPSFSPTLTASTEHEPSPTSSATATLASRLQELAVANADGLLDDSEYRILRQQLFANHTKGGDGKKQVEVNVVKLSEGSLAVPRLNGAPRSSPASITSFNDEHKTMPPTSPPRTRLAAPSPASLRAPSIVSTQSKRHSILPPLASLFRRDPTSTVQLEEDWDVVTPPLASPLNNESSTPPLASDNRSTFSDRSSRTALSPPTSPIRTRSIRNHPGLASSAMDSRSSSYFAGSSRSSNGRSFGGGAESVFSSSKSNGDAPRSPTSLRTRHYNGGGGGSSMYSHGFSSSNHSHDRGSGVETLLSHSLPPITSSTDPLLFAATDREPTVKELEREIREIEDEWKRMRESWKDIVQQRVETWEKQVGGNVAASAREAAMLEAYETGGGDTREQEKPGKGDNEKKETFKRASFLPSRSTPPPIIASTLSLPSFLLSPSHPIPSDFVANLPPHLLEPTRAFQTEIGEILERQKRTEEKYERRLEFLRAKERGARIKQRLLK